MRKLQAPLLNDRSGEPDATGVTTTLVTLTRDTALTRDCPGVGSSNPSNSREHGITTVL
jgi:hypothetical protein